MSNLKTNGRIAEYKRLIDKLERIRELLKSRGGRRIVSREIRDKWL